VWIIIVSGVIAMATMAVAAHRRTTNLDALGSVSEAWLSEYRAGQPGNSP